MFKWLYIAFIALICGCSAGTELTGTYASKKIPYSLMLNNDSTYSYRYKFQIEYEYSLGKWINIGNNAVELNSHFKTRLLPVEVKPGNIAGSSNINFNFITPDFERKSYECLIFVDGALLEKRKCDPVLSISIKKPVTNIYLGITADRMSDLFIPTIVFDTLYTNKFYPASDSANSYTLRVVYNDSLFNYRVFDNEIFKIRKRGLVFYDPKRKFRKAIPKRK